MRNTRARRAKARARVVREHPTHHVHRDPNAGETLITGVGERQHDVYVARMRREYGCDVVTGG